LSQLFALPEKLPEIGLGKTPTIIPLYPPSIILFLDLLTEGPPFHP
jgi:hypothetical protein